ncbi:hypothetical protein BKA82DRAFT_4087461 [Pisolithus tinctorius]|nr:hypothetical protein BKA82DRAFT_4087461 [Pisolithus tinctorius]
MSVNDSSRKPDHFNDPYKETRRHCQAPRKFATGNGDLANTEGFKDVVVARQRYEWLNERIKRWWGGNWNAAQ